MTRAHETSLIQADSIVPGAGDPLAFDRYSYVRNNPANLVDPSGHGQYCGDDYDPGCLNEEELINYYIETGKPDRLDPNLLWDYWTTSNTGVSGADYYQLYLDMWHDSSWWWAVFGADGQFTVWDFIATMFIRKRI